MLAVKPMGRKSAPFDESVTQAYTHGFEQIYALETIDPSTVKKITISQPVIEETPVKLSSQHEDLWDGQYELELGDEYRYWMPPLFLKEPVQMLGLSQRTEIVCIDRGIERIVDLIGLDFKDWIGEKGVGQGHLDEIQQKLRQYIEGRSLERSYYIEWAAFVRSLTVGLDRKKAFLLLESYGLQSYLPLSPIERMESLNLQSQTKKIWIEEALQGFKESSRSVFVKEILTQITRVFLSPWMRARGGVVNRYEILERIEKVSQEPEILEGVIRFIEDVYALDTHPLACGLVEVDRGLFCPDHFTANAYHKICEKAKSYFYQPHLAYRFSELTDLLAKEFGSLWEGFPCILADVSLKRSPLFRVRKGESGSLFVKLHP